MTAWYGCQGWRPVVYYCPLMHHRIHPWHPFNSIVCLKRSKLTRLFKPTRLFSNSKEYLFNPTFSPLTSTFVFTLNAHRIHPLGPCSARRVFPTYRRWTSPPSPRGPRLWRARRSAYCRPPGARPSGDSSKKLKPTETTLYCTSSILE